MMAATALLHLYVAFIAEPHEYIDEYPWLGVLFTIGSAAGFGVAWRLWTRASPAAWTIGTLIAAGMFVGYVISRSVGLFGFYEDYFPWTGTLSLGLEAAFLIAWEIAGRRAPEEVLPGFARRMLAGAASDMTVVIQPEAQPEAEPRDASPGMRR